METLAPVDFQTILNMVFGAVLVIAGWLIRIVYDAMKDLQRADKELTEDIGEIKVLVAGNYITRPEFDKKLDALFKKLDEIHALVHSKADRPDRRHP
jgi:hypothetical protein